MTRDDETAISEITIRPDGRVYVFGMSRQVLEGLECLQTGDPRLERLQEQLCSCTTSLTLQARTTELFGG